MKIHPVVFQLQHVYVWKLDSDLGSWSRDGSSPYVHNFFLVPPDLIQIHTGISKSLFCDDWDSFTASCTKTFHISVTNVSIAPCTCPVVELDCCAGGSGVVLADAWRGRYEQTRTSRRAKERPASVCRQTAPRLSESSPVVSSSCLHTAPDTSGPRCHAAAAAAARGTRCCLCCTFNDFCSPRTNFGARLQPRHQSDHQERRRAREPFRVLSRHAPTTQPWSKNVSDASKPSCKDMLHLRAWRRWEHLTRHIQLNKLEEFVNVNS